MKLITNGTDRAGTTVPAVGAQTARLPLATAPPGIGDTVKPASEDRMCPNGGTGRDFLRAYIDGRACRANAEAGARYTGTDNAAEHPVADLAGTVSDLMAEVDKIKLGVTES